MSRKRDTNWSRDEITVLLDSIMEITRTRANDNKRTNSREVFEYAAKKMDEKGHTSRAEREKCRTKWKKMKEEFTHAKRFREGDGRYKEAPGIQPFFDRMEEFINGNFDNISPHSTIVRRTSNLVALSGKPSSSTPSPSSGQQQIQPQPQQQQAMRTSARIAANTNGNTQQPQQPIVAASISSSSMNNNNSNLNDNNMDQDTNSTIATKTTTDYSTPNIHTLSNGSSLSPQNSRVPSSANNNNININNNNANNNGRNNPAPPTATVTATNQLSLQSNQQQLPHNHLQNNHHQQQLQQAIPKGDSCLFTNVYNNPNNHSGHQNNNNQNHNPNISSGSNHHNLSSSSTTSSNMLYNSINETMHVNNNNNNNHINNHNNSIGNTNQADISYRVSTGYRQITIFGDHDVDIKFRGDCVTINKIDLDCAPSTQSGPSTTITGSTTEQVNN